MANLDRRVSLAGGTFSGSYTTWTLPYSVPDSGAEGEVAVVRQDTGELLDSRRPSNTTVRVDGDYSAVPVWVGILYDFRYVPTRIFPRNEAGIPEVQGRVQLRYLDIYYAETDSLTVALTRAGRAPYSKSVTSPGTGQLRLPVLAENKQTSIEITDRSPGKVRLVGYEWEGFITQRSRRT